MTMTPADVQPTCGYHLVAEQIAAAGVRDLFGVVGDDTIATVTELVDRGVRYHAARHEAAAVGMADGYSWATGEIGVCTVTRGPGLLNALTAARTAARGNRAVLIVTGEMPRGGTTSDVKHLDAAAVVGAAGIAFLGVSEPGAVAATTREALALAKSGVTCVLAIADDLLSGPAHEASATTAAPAAAPAPPVPPAPTEAEIAGIAKLLAASRRPLILVGRGGADAATRALLAALADRVDARIGTTLPLRGLFSGHRRNLGVVGGFASDPAVDTLAEIDCVVAFGAGLNRFTTAERTLFTDASVVHVDTDHGALGRFLEVDVGVVGRADVVARRLLAAIPEPLDRGAAAMSDLGQPTYLGPDESGADGLDPRVATVELAALLAAERAIVVDSGRFMGWPTRFVATPGPQEFRLTVEFGAIGAGLGVALGAAIARPNALTVLFAGDGGLSNLLGDLETVANCGVPLLVVVYNDSSYGAEFRVQRARGLDPALAGLRTVEFAAVAGALGLRAATVRDLGELRALADELRALDAPFLIDLRIRELDIDSGRMWR
jgi:acetolactate synthase-1/2/3 large subunit